MKLELTSSSWKMSAVVMGPRLRL